MKEKSALIIIDVQNDFCDHAVLAARDTDTLIEPLNRFITWAQEKGMMIVFVRDWHPPDHCSFIPRGGPWPPHCVQGTYGARFARGMMFPETSLVIDIESESEQQNLSYSAFENTPLHERLDQAGVREVITVGIATEYCVKETALDALKLGYKVTFLTDLVRPINIQPDDAEKAIVDLRCQGVQITSAEILIIHKMMNTLYS